MAEADGWRRLWRLEMTPGLAVTWTILSLVLFAASVAGVIALIGHVHRDVAGGVLPALLALLLAVPVTLVLHEAVHGIAFRVVGGRPRFGAGVRYGLPYLFASCPGQRFARNPFLFVGLAPLVVLDLAGVALVMSPWAVTVAAGASAVVTNTAGAIGDLWMSVVLLQAPSWMHVEDFGLGFVALAPPDRLEEAARRRPPIGLDVSMPRWLVIWLPSLFVSWPMIFAGLVLASSLARAELRIGMLELARPVRHGALANAAGVTVLAAVASTLVALVPSIMRAVRVAVHRPR